MLGVVEAATTSVIDVSYLQRFATWMRRRPVVQQYVFSIGLVGVAHVLYRLSIWLVSPLPPVLLGSQWYAIAVVLTAFATSETGPLAIAVIAGMADAAYLTHPWTGEMIMDDVIRLVAYILMALTMWHVTRAERRARASALRRATEAIAATQAKDRFLATVSHDLRQPLAGIEMWTRIIKRDVIKKLPSSPTRDLLDRSIDAIGNASTIERRLVEDLLEVARITSGKLTLQLQPLSLDNLLHYALDTVKPAAETKKVVLLPPLPTDVRCLLDRERTQQIFWNLLSNAVKFTTEGGCVGVTIDPDASRRTVLVTISDTGRGIDHGDLGHLFEPWWQHDHSETGLGLGLMITKRLVELHGGSIRATSSGPGSGSAFVVTLPMQAVP